MIITKISQVIFFVFFHSSREANYTLDNARERKCYTTKFSHT